MHNYPFFADTITGTGLRNSGSQATHLSAREEVTVDKFLAKNHT